MNEDLRFILGDLWRVFRTGVLIVAGSFLLMFMSIPCWFLFSWLILRGHEPGSYNVSGLPMLCCSFGASLLILTGVALWRIRRIQRRQRMAPPRRR